MVARGLQLLLKEDEKRQQKMHRRGLVCIYLEGAGFLEA